MARHSRITNPGSPFSTAEYLAFMQEYHQFRRNELHQGSMKLNQQRRAMVEYYRSRLPRYLLARCPFCGEEVWEPIDTYSFQGCGWFDGRWTGYGWYGQIEEAPGHVTVSYETKCPHAYIVSVCLAYAYGAEKPYRINPSHLERVAEGPYVMSHPMKQPAMQMVVRGLEVGSAEPDPATQSRRIYLSSYFVPDAAAWAEEDALWSGGEYHSYVCYPLDYHLEPWLASGRLHWLDPHDPTLPLRSIDDGPFPYPQHRPRSWWRFW
jgi:hypothetical protein